MRLAVLSHVEFNLGSHGLAFHLQARHYTHSISKCARFGRTQPRTQLGSSYLELIRAVAQTI